MASKGKKLVDAVLEASRQRAAKKPVTWFDRLDADTKAELLELRRAWKAAEIRSSARGLAIDILAACAERGIVTCGTEGMRAWLAKD